MMISLSRWSAVFTFIFLLKFGGICAETLDISENSTQSLQQRFPQAIIIGVKKAGTRALLEYLRLHPRVRAPGPEIHFFDRHYDRGLEWYRHQMPPTNVDQLTIEKTPSYFIRKEVPARIAAMNPNSKLLVVVRDPVTRAISDYAQSASKRPEILKFEELAFDPITGEVNSKWRAIKIGLYAKHLRRWLKYFGKDRILVVSGEALIADPVAEMRPVEEFLQLNPIISSANFRYNSTSKKGFPCLIRNPDEIAKPHCLGKTKGRQHPQISNDLLQRLRDFYAPANREFYELVGRDFGW